jgi:hypothetical protein
MRIKRFNESSDNSDFVTTQEIEQFFYDWTDEDLGTLEIKDILITPDNRAIPYTTYIKDPKKYKKAKLVIFTLNQKLDGIQIDSRLGGDLAKSFTEFETLEKILTDIRRFYIHTAEENINYKIVPHFTGIKIFFITSGPVMKDDESTVKEIDELLGELRDLFKRNFKNTKKTGSYVEIRIPEKRWREDPRRILNTILNNPNYTAPPASYEYNILTIINKIREKGYELVVSGGDNQVLLQLKKI